jgi:Kef-type K+ transport system membrane component KefB
MISPLAGQDYIDSWFGIINMRTTIVCLLALGVFGLGIFAIFEQGRSLASPSPTVTQSSARPASAESVLGVEPSSSLFANLRENLQDPLPRLFLQLIIIVLAARLAGALAAKIGQPTVIGEMIAGILLGPSLLGWVWPDAFHFVFQTSSLGSLRLLSQIGVCLFMFVVGMELDVTELKQQARTAAVVSQMSILFPYLLGTGSALFLFPTLAGSGTTFPVFALFIGISMSLTAFPVLARILQERNLTQTALGSTAIACAATNDVAAWSILAFVVAVAKAQSVLATAFTVGLVLLFVVFMLFWIKPRLPQWMENISRRNGGSGKGIMASALVILFASAFATEMMGIHALFGSFLAGLVMPGRGELREFLRLRLEHFSAVFLLPLFFAFIGLRTQIGLLNDTAGWMICLGLILVATVGKLGGTMVTARLTGVNWIDSFALGALMNTRGLVELIALNIGYDMGILSPRIFAMLVIMALLTTCLTGPLLSFGDHLRAKKAFVARPV